MKGMLKNRHCIKETQKSFRYLDQGLSGWNILEKGVMLSCGRRRLSDISPYYSVDDDLVYWNNFQELIEEVQLEYTSEQRRPFINSSKIRFMAVLFHFPSIWLAHAVHMKEIWENFQVLLQKIGHEEHRWNYVCWPNVIVILPGVRTN